jgi:DNA polymerase III sliding clamp (beta) subunit (PCNA family)
MDVKREELLNALKLVRPGLASTALVEQSTNFAFVDGNVVTYNDAISVSCPIPSLKGLTGAVSSDELFAFVNQSSHDQLSMDVVEGELRVKAGRAKIGLKLASEIMFPLDEVKPDNKWYDIPKGFLDGVKIALYSVSKDASMPGLTCVHFKGARIESSDNIRMTRYECESALGAYDLLLPSKAADELLKYKVTKFCVASKENWMHFLVDGEAIMSCRLLKTKYPDLTSILNVSGEKISLPKKIAGTLDKAGVFSKREHALDQVVDISLEGRRMLVKAQSDIGWFEEEVGIRYEGPNISFSVHPEFLSTACDRETTCTISTNRMKFVAENWQHVIALKG